jgi:precorrin-2 methylase
VDFVMKQTPLKIKENIVIVERYKEEEEKDLSTIEVHGITDMKRNLEKVLLYFKNKRHSNGGNIVSHHVDAEKNIVSIKFESREGLYMYILFSKKCLSK